MPRISAFFGIVIRMYWNERDHPVPHLHAEYAEHRAAIDLDGQVLGGTMPPRALRFIREWTELHRDELMANWNRARDRQPLEEIEPLS
jgi:hypothetical protein